MCFSFRNFGNLFARRSRRHPSRRLTYVQSVESMEPRVVLSAVSAAVAVEGVVADDVDVRLGEDGNNLLIVNNGDGSDFMEARDGSGIDRGTFNFEHIRLPQAASQSGGAALISSYQSSGAAGGDSVPQDSFSINFAKIEAAPVAGEDGNDLLIVNNGDGSDYMEARDGSGIDRGTFNYEHIRLPQAASQDGNDLLIGNNGDGSDYERSGDVLLSSYQSSGAAGGDSVPQDSFSINFARIDTHPVEGEDGNYLLIVNNGDDSDCLPSTFGLTDADDVDDQRAIEYPPDPPPVEYIDIWEDEL